MTNITYCYNGVPEWLLIHYDCVRMWIVNMLVDIAVTTTAMWGLILKYFLCELILATSLPFKWFSLNATLQSFSHTYSSIQPSQFLHIRSFCIMLLFSCRAFCQKLKLLPSPLRVILYSFLIYSTNICESRFWQLFQQTKAFPPSSVVFQVLVVQTLIWLSNVYSTVLQGGGGACQCY